MNGVPSATVASKPSSCFQSVSPGSPRVIAGRKPAGRLVVAAGERSGACAGRRGLAFIFLLGLSEDGVGCTMAGQWSACPSESKLY
jgi:hypothetical protein